MSFDIQTLLGRRDDPVLHVYARQLIERISASSEKPLLLAIALKEDGRGPAFFQDIVNKVIELRTW